MAAFAAQARFLHTAERCRRAGRVDVVDTDNPKTQTFKRAHGGRQILGIDVGGKPVVGVVCHRHHIVVVAVGDDGRDWTSIALIVAIVMAVFGALGYIYRDQIFGK